jgi:hypothetical protein
MPNPGVQSQFIAKSGRQQVPSASTTSIGTTTRSRARTCRPAISRPTAFKGTNGSNAIRDGANEILDYYDHDINAGGPIKKDKALVFRHRSRAAEQGAQPNFQFDKTFDTKLWNLVGKGPISSIRRTS